MNKYFSLVVCGVLLLRNCGGSPTATLSVSSISFGNQVSGVASAGPWISRLLGELGHEVIVANARKVRLIGESRKKDDRLDAQTLPRLARIDSKLL
jgi:hypothetical protein